MKDSLGWSVGVLLAHYQKDLSDDPGNTQRLETFCLATEAYRNLSSGSIKDFDEDFEAGYEQVKGEYRRDLEYEEAPDSGYKHHLDPTPG